MMITDIMTLLAVTQLILHGNIRRHHHIRGHIISAYMHTYNFTVYLISTTIYTLQNTILPYTNVCTFCQFFMCVPFCHMNVRN
jgi:hypothetical protein